MHKTGKISCSFVFHFIGNYQKFYSAIKSAYPDINIISSCDRPTISPSNPADLYDVHVMSQRYVPCLLEQCFSYGWKRHHLLLQVYTSSTNMFSKASMFDNTPRGAPKVFFLMLSVYLRWFMPKLMRRNTLTVQAIVSEYAVTGNDAGKGTLVAALAEAAFLIGLERNRLAVVYPFFLILEFCQN
jgi:alpha-L-arabinofuranosidase